MDQASLVSALVGIGSFLVMFNLMSYIKKTEVQVCPVDVKPEMYEADDEVEAEEEVEEEVKEGEELKVLDTKIDELVEGDLKLKEDEEKPKEVPIKRRKKTK